MWNLLFAVYGLLLNTSLLTLISLALALYIIVKLILRIVQKRKEGSEGEDAPTSVYLDGWAEAITDALYDTSNGLLNWLARIFTNSDIIEIALGVLLLYLLETFCFYASDALIVCVLGNIIILLKGFKAYSQDYLANLSQMK